MTTNELAEVLALLIADDRDEINPANIRTFEEAHLMTPDAGLVVELEDGAEFQLTIVRSR